MAEGNLLVTFGAVEQASSDVHTVASNIANELQDLKGYLAPLVASWDGTASSDWQQLQNRWNSAADDLQKVLAQISTALQTAATNYTNTETTNASIWG